MKKSLMRYFFLGYFFSDNTRLFGIIWASLWEKLFSGVGDVQAGLRLCCSQTPEDRVSRVEAHIIAVFMIRAIVNELHPTFFFVLFV